LSNICNYFQRPLRNYKNYFVTIPKQVKLAKGLAKKEKSLYEDLYLIKNFTSYQS